MKKSFLFCFLLVSVVTFAQKFTISGVVQDKDETPLSYTIITLKNLDEASSEPIEAITDDYGVYSAMVTKGRYTITFDAIGYDIKSSNVQIDKNIEFNVDLENRKQLNDVVVSAEEPIYRFELDKKVFDVGRDATTKGGTLSDVLEGVPSVSVDIDGTVNIRGNSNVKFLVNGKPSSMFGISNTADVLRTIPASSIERIEVITNPSSRYEAEGTSGILNIVMKEDSNLGFNGNVEAHVGYLANYGTQANLNWNYKKWGWFINPGVNYSESKGKNKVRLLSRDLDHAKDSISTQESERWRKPFTFNVSTGAHYNISEKDIVSANVSIRRSIMQNTNDLNYFDYTSEGNLIDITNRFEDEDERDFQFQGVLNYDHNFNKEGKKLSLGLNFQDSGEVEDAQLQEVSQIYSPSEQRSLNKEDQNQIVVNADYANPFKKGANFELGYMGKFTANENDFLVESFKNGIWETNTNFTDNIRYNEDINAFYSQYGNTFGKFSFQLGLRSEISHITVESKVDQTKVVKDYIDFFPTSFLNYNFTEHTQIQINYSRRINRPRGRFLNPFFSFADERNTFRGNPNLNPSYTNSLELGMSFSKGKFKLYPQLYYRNTLDDISIYVQQQQVQINDSLQYVFVAQPYNIGTNNSYGLEVSFQYTPLKWWKMFGEIRFFGYEQKGNAEVFDFNAKDTSWNARYTANFDLPKKVDFQIQANYRGPQTNGQNTREGVFTMNLGLSKDILNNKGTLNFNVRDVFNSRKMKITTDEPAFSRNLEMQWRQRQINLSFTYRFNQKKKKDRGDRIHDGDDGGLGF